MELLEGIKTRRSVRKYLDKPVEQEKLDRIIEAGLYAASGMNRQLAVILQVTDPETLKTIAAENTRVAGAAADMFYGAPAALIVLVPVSSATRVYDGSLVMGTMMLEAHEQGLGSCWIHRAKEVFETETGKAILKKAGIEGEYEGIGNLIVGYPDGPLPEAKPRREGRVYKI